MGRLFIFGTRGPDAGDNLRGIALRLRPEVVQAVHELLDAGLVVPLREMR